MTNDTSDDLMETLFLPLEQGAAASGGKTLFLNAFPGPALRKLARPVLQQCDRVTANALKRAGFDSVPETAEEGFDLALVAGAKQHDEMCAQIALALRKLRPGGTLVCAAANDAGGKRLKKIMEEAGLSATVLSKNKARVACAAKDGNIDAERIQKWLEAAAPQKIAGGAFVSQPGIFGWDKIDTGSALLAAHLPALSGAGADFGCGYGYLAALILKNNPDVRAIQCIDSDWRAVRACETNLAEFGARAACLWEDLTASAPAGLDWVVMNPPFHAGKKEMLALGRAFIAQAARSLKSGGSLWLVANAHLPYEETLAEIFPGHETVTQDKGFKVIHARKR
jgi:16S rRNA (guanine1207-N2)-methyltransferase